MQGMYNYTPETNHVSRVNSVAAVLYIQFVLHVMPFRQWNMFCTFTLALPVVCVCSAQNGCFLFCIFLISFFPGTVFKCCQIFFFYRYGCSRPYYCRYHFCLHIPHTLNLLWGLYIFESSQLLSWSHFCLQELQHLLTFRRLTSTIVDVPHR